MLSSASGGNSVKSGLNTAAIPESATRVGMTTAPIARDTRPASRRAFLEAGPEEVYRVSAAFSDEELASLVSDLAGHDLESLLEAFDRCDRVTDRPSVIYAYTLKAWRLPTEGHPGNHSALLTPGQWRDLARFLDVDADDPWQPFSPDSPEGRACTSAAERLRPGPTPAPRAVEVPADLAAGRRHRATESTQQTLGRFLLAVAREAPSVAERIVTVSPDVASSTNLGGWINKVGIWNTRQRPDWFSGDTETLIHWAESRRGQHVMQTGDPGGDSLYYPVLKGIKPRPGLPSLSSVKVQHIDPYKWGAQEGTLNTWFVNNIIH